MLCLLVFNNFCMDASLTFWVFILQCEIFPAPRAHCLSTDQVPYGMLFYIEDHHVAIGVNLSKVELAKNLN